MIKKNTPWKDNSNGELLQYDFIPDSHWTSERVAEEQRNIAEMLSGTYLSQSSPSPKWLELARRLPEALRGAIVAELRVGNRLLGIGTSGWPTSGSIVVNMSNQFSAARHKPPIGVVWRELNDPHYCREELSQRVGPVEFLAIT